MNTRDKAPTAEPTDLPDLPDDVKTELLRRVENLPNETLIPSEKAFEELQRRASEREPRKPA